MSRNPFRVTILTLLALTSAACRVDEPTSPLVGSRAHFAQGDNGVWTVNSLADPGDGVCTDTDCTLREALSSIVSSGQVVFAPGFGGSIQLSSSLSTFGKSFSISGEGRITISGQDAFTALAIGTDVPITVTLDGLALRGGYSASSGGALRIDGSPGPATVTVSNTFFSDNTSDGNGGAIWVGPGNFMTLVNTVFFDNQTAGLGGAVHNNGTLTVRRSSFSNNAAANGGAIYNEEPAAATITLSTISGNEATDNALQHASGIANDGDLNVISATIATNGQNGIGQYAPDAVTTIRNTLVIANACAFLAGSQTSLGHNMSDTPSSCELTASTDVSLSGVDVFTQVLEPDLKPNNAFSFTHALIARGLAVDAGKCVAETMDQRGSPRPFDDLTVPNAADACDIGAYESQGAQPPVADLLISQSVDLTTVKQGDLLTYTVRVRNLGPETAPGVVVTNVLSSGVTFVEARASKGFTTGPLKGETGTVTWNLGNMASQANEYAEIHVTVIVRGRAIVTNTASVAANIIDPNTGNNSAAISVTVASGKGGSKK